MPSNNTKIKILHAAEKLVSQNSISHTTISAVAQCADVSDSHIYQYFKNKEDLLFAVAYERVKDVYEQLGEQLKGIRDISSQLSRIIWHHLDYNDNNPGYFRILFDCFAKKEFYETQACRQGKEIADVVLYILQKGVSEGIFRSDINMRLVQLIIIGTIDVEAISHILLGEVKSTSKDLDHILNLIYPMILKKTSTKKERKRDLIIQAAKKVLAENSYTKAKLSDIAKSAGLGEKTLYYYFKDKEDIVFSVCEDKFNTDDSFSDERIMMSTSSQKLKRFLETHFWRIAGDPDFCKTFISEIQSNKKFYGSKHYEYFQTYYKQLESILEQGKKDGSFNENLNPRVYRNMFLGAFTRIVLRWIIFGTRHSFDQFSEASQCIHLFLKAAENDI